MCLTVTFAVERPPLMHACSQVAMRASYPCPVPLRGSSSSCAPCPLLTSLCSVLYLVNVARRRLGNHGPQGRAARFVPN